MKKEELRACSYTPKPIKLPSADPQTGEVKEEDYLMVAERVQGANHWAAEQEPPVSLVITEGDHEGDVVLNGDMVIVKSRIYMNGELSSVGIGSAGLSVPSAVEQAATKAKGRALANLGFGTSEADGAENPNDVSTLADSPVAPTAPSSPVTPTAPFTPTAPTAPAAPIPTTREEALATVCTAGKSKGKKVYELLGDTSNGINAVRYFAEQFEDKTGKHKAFIQACRIILSTEGG
jgi:hypothetical protein